MIRTVELGSIALNLPASYGSETGNYPVNAPVVKVSNIGAGGNLKGIFETRSFPEDKFLSLKVDHNDLLVVKSSGSKANILSGKTAICPRELDGKLVASNFVLRLKIKANLACPKFVWHYLNSGWSKAFVKGIVGASTYPNIKWSSYKTHPIPLPPLEEQRRIAEILDLADGLRVKRREALAEVEGLTQAVFLEMFGDPRIEHRYQAKALQELGKIHTGKTPPTKEKSHFGGHIPFVTPGDLNSNKIVQRTLTQKGANKSKFVKAGSALVCCIGATIGKMALAQEDCCFNQQINAVEWERSLVTPHYGIEALRFLAETIARKGSSTTLPILNKSDFSKLRLPLPPLPLQQEFAERVEAIEKLKASHQRSLEEMDALFASLQSRAFKGEL